MSNLIRTRKGDRPFRPDYGSTVHKYLFDHGIFAENELNKSLYETIQKFEQRIVVTKIESKFEGGDIDVTVDYIIKNINVVGTFQTTITRVT